MYTNDLTFQLNQAIFFRDIAKLSLLIHKKDAFLEMIRQD